MKQTSNYGTWNSLISATWVSLGQKRLGNLALESEGLYWSESRPAEQGRTTVMLDRWGQGLQECIPDQMSCRSRVHEYGGGAFAVDQGHVYFVNDKDQRIYSGKTPLSPEGMRAGDLHIHAPFLIGVGEHRSDHVLFALHLPSGQCTTIAQGHDFYASPTISPDGTSISYLTWNHPQMPWDGTSLWVGMWVDGKIIEPRVVMGGPSESVFQPSWSPEGTLHAVSDRTGWWNLYACEKEGCRPLHPMEAEFGVPLWNLATSTYGFVGHRLVSSYTRDALWNLAWVIPWEPISLPWTWYSNVKGSSSHVGFIGGSSIHDRSVICYNPRTKHSRVVTHHTHPHLDEGDISQAQRLSFSGSRGHSVHALYYPPTSTTHEAPSGTLPPLLVILHGGPTGQAFPLFDLKIQFWTSRGFAVLDVNYRGSSGYGRAYRQLLHGEWGVADVEDCHDAVRYLIAQGWVHPAHIAIRGSSAGGYSTLAALMSGSLFSVGAVYYGVGDLSALAQETHSFEAHYLDTLVGPYPDAQALYEARSPILHIERLRVPVIFFHGGQDRIVPLSQAEAMYRSLKQHSIPTELVIYPEEGHGFRSSETIKDSLEKELEFYLQTWGIR